MTFDLWLMLAPASLAGALFLALLYRQIYRVGDRTADQVLPSISPLGAMGVHELFSAVAEHHLRRNLTPDQFRRAQRHRIILALEYMRRISHNALVLQQWASYEMACARVAADQKRSRLSADVIAATVQCRMCSFMLSTRLRCWWLRTALLPFAKLPSFDALVRFGSTDLLYAYSRVRTAAGQLSRSCGEVQRNKLAEFL
jgi:hypothetical protein